MPHSAKPNSTTCPFKVYNSVVACRKCTAKRENVMKYNDIMITLQLLRSGRSVMVSEKISSQSD
jgi:hypothetical protein